MAATKSTVHGIVLDPAGNPLGGSTVTVDLANHPTSAIPAVGFVPADSTEILSPKVATADAFGAWSMSLYGTADIDPAGTVYRATYRNGGVTFAPLHFNMPNDGSSNWIQDRVVDPPVDLLAGELTTYTPTFRSGDAAYAVASMATSGEYQRLSAGVGVLSIYATATSNFAITLATVPFMELSLPPGWISSPTKESFLSGYVIPMPGGFGLHHAITGVIHKNYGWTRAIAGSPSGIGQDFAVDGITIPTHFTGDGGGPNDDILAMSGLVFLTP